MAERQPSIEERISASLSPEPVAEAPTEAAPVETAPETPQLEAVETEQPTEQPEQPEQAEQTEELPQASDETAEAVEEEALEVSSISDLAEHLGVETADLYNVSIPITDANGERKEVSLGEWKDTFQNNERAQRLAQESEALKAELQSQQQQAAEAMERQAQEGAMFLNQVQQTYKLNFSQSIGTICVSTIRPNGRLNDKNFRSAMANYKPCANKLLKHTSKTKRLLVNSIKKN